MVSLQNELKKKIWTLNMDNNLKKHMILVGSGEQTKLKAGQKDMQKILKHEKNEGYVIPWM